MALTFVVPGLDEAASEKAIAILQNRLSQEQEAALVLKHAHWNVTGPNFIAVHEMLDPQVEAMLGMADETAERIATMGGAPDGSADAITRNRTWKPFDLEGRHSTEEYLQALIEYYDAMIVDDRKAIAELDELDLVSSNIMQDHVQELEKFQWFMRRPSGLTRFPYTQNANRTPPEGVPQSMRRRPPAASYRPTPPYSD